MRGLSCGAAEPAIAGYNLGLLKQRDDIEGAETWYRLAAEADNTSAAYNLGVLLGQQRSRAGS